MATKTTTTKTTSTPKYSSTVANQQAAYNAANISGIKAGTVTPLAVDGINGPKTQAALGGGSSATTTAPKITTGGSSTGGKIPVPVLGSTAYDASGKAIGVNKYDPNTGLPLTATAATVMGTDPAAVTVKKVFAAPQYDKGYVKGLDEAIGYYGKEATTPLDEESVRQKAVREFQAEIDATNNVYASKLAEAKIQGNNRLGSDNAIQARRGLLGSDFGNTQTEGKIALNLQEQDAVEQEKLAKVGGIMARANAAGAAAVAAKRAAKEAGTAEYVKYLKERGSIKEQNAYTAASAIVAQGLAIEDLDPIQLKALASAYGITVDSIKAAYPDAKLKRETELAASEKAGGTKTASIQEYEYAVEHGYKGTYSDYQNEDANRKAVIAGTTKNVGDLNPATAAKVQAQASAFETAPIVKDYNVVQNKKFSVDRILDSGVGGPADLALVFEFMKALDPNSVVRETEYDTASKSGNIFSGIFAKFNGYFKPEGGFLPPTVKEGFQALINQKLEAITQQYTNLRNEKARIINKYTGNTDGADYLVDYGGAANQSGTTTANVPTGDGLWDF